MIPSNIIDEIKFKTNIVDIVGEVADLKKFGTSYKSSCPFLDHSDKTPSFSVSETRQIFKCFGCGKSGNVFTFLMEYHGHTFIEAVKELAERAGVQIPQQNREESDLIEQIYEMLGQYANMTAGHYHLMQMDYFQKRGLSQEVIEKYNLGYDDDDNALNSVLVAEEAGLVYTTTSLSVQNRFAHRYTFPIQDGNGRVLSIGGTNKDATPKYLNGSDTKVYHKSNVLYGLYQAKEALLKKKYAILVEGYMDCLQMVNQGYLNTVASCGTSVTSAQVKLLSRYVKDIILFFDGDEAGRNAINKVFVLAFDQGMDLYVVDTPDGSDPDSLALSDKPLTMKLVQGAQSWVDRNLKRTSDLARRRWQIQLVSSLLPEFENDDRRLAFLDMCAQKLGVDYRIFTHKKHNGSKGERYNVSELIEQYPEQMQLLSSCLFNPKAKEIVPEEYFSEPALVEIYHRIIQSIEESDLYVGLDEEQMQIMTYLLDIYEKNASNFEENKFLSVVDSFNRKIKQATLELRDLEKKGAEMGGRIRELTALIDQREKLFNRRGF